MHVLLRGRLEAGDRDASPASSVLRLPGPANRFQRVSCGCAGLKPPPACSIGVALCKKASSAGSWECPANPALVRI